MFRRQSDLFFGIVLTLIFVGLAVTNLLPSILRTILAIPFALFVPGNALMSAIFPGSSLRRLEWFLFTIGSSLGVLVFSGLVLNLTPWGLQTNSWLVVLSGFSLLTSVIALWRRRKIPLEAPKSVQFFIPGRQVPLLSLAIVVIGLALILTLTPQSSHNIQGYTSLWILPESDSQSGTHLVGIHNQELRTTLYDLEVTYNGQSVKKWLDISLAPGLEWQQSINTPTGQGLVEAVLYLKDNPGVVYRHVSITVNK